MNDDLQRYLDRGWRLFPCHSVVGRPRQCTCGSAECSKVGKHPRTLNGVKDASREPAVIDWWLTRWASSGINWAVATGDPSGVFVVDTDRQHDGEWREDLWGPEPRTLTTFTGNGGRHYYFSMPDDGLPLGNRNGLVPGVDVKSTGGYVILPPSAHASGQLYAWKDQGAEIIPALPELVGWIRSTPLPSSSAGSDGAELVREGARNETLFRYACKVRRRLQDDRDGVEGAVHARNLRRCVPPLDRFEVDKIIESAFKQDHSDSWLDDLTEQEYFREVARRSARRRADVEEQAKLWTPPPSLMTVKDELAQPTEPPRYTVESLQREGHNVLLAAQFKTGKTTLQGNYLRALVDGELFLDRFVVRGVRGRVAFWNYELQPDEFRDYLRRLDILNPDRASVLHLRGHRMPLGVEQVEKWVIDWLTTREVEVLILDPWARVMSGNGSENSNDDVTRMTEAIDVIKAEAGVRDLLLSAHTPRAFMEQGEERARGASRLDDWADARWLYTRTDDGARYLRAEGRGVALSESRLDFDPATERLTLAGGSRRENAVSRIEDEIVALVTATPGRKTSDVLDQVTTTTNATERGKALRAAKLTGRVHAVPGPKTTKLLHPGPEVPGALDYLGGAL